MYVEVLDCGSYLFLLTSPISSEHSSVDMVGAPLGPQKCDRVKRGIPRPTRPQVLFSGSLGSLVTWTCVRSDRYRLSMNRHYTRDLCLLP